MKFEDLKIGDLVEITAKNCLRGSSAGTFKASGYVEMICPRQVDLSYCWPRRILPIGLHGFLKDDIVNIKLIAREK